MDDDNLHADTFCCRRLICDTVAYYGSIYAIDTSNKALLLSCSSAWLKYQPDLEQKKKDAMKDTVTQKRKAVDDANHRHYCWALEIFIVSHGLQMIWCQQSSFIISAVLVSTLKYIFHSKFWCSASMICHFIDTFVLENCNFRSLRSPWKVLEFCPFSLLWTLSYVTACVSWWNCLY